MRAVINRNLYMRTSFKRFCQCCTKEFRDTEAEMRFCSIVCQENFDIEMRHCPNCGNRVTGINSKVFCDRRCHAIHNKRKYYPTKGSYSKPRKEATTKEEWLKRALTEKKKYCRKTNILFSLTSADIILPDVCPILGVSLAYPPTRDQTDLPRFPSLDRIFPDLGYTVGNTRIISLRANTLKNAATAEESVLIALDMWRFLPFDHPLRLELDGVSNFLSRSS